jgi:anti-sigma factor RsiW
MSIECKEHLGCLSEYVDGDLDPELCAELERHMAECGDCRVVVDTLRKTVSLYRSYGHEDLPPDAKERLYAVLKLEAGSYSESDKDSGVMTQPPKNHSNDP